VYESDLKRLNQRKRKRRLDAARKKGSHTKEQWEALKAEFGRCVRCGTDEYFLFKDHIIPIYQGGSDGVDNLQPLCAFCNTSKGAENFNWAEYRRAHGWHGLNLIKA